MADENNKNSQLDDRKEESVKRQQNYKDTKSKIETGVHITAATGELRSVGTAILELVEKGEKALNHIANLPVIRDIHFLAMAVSGISLLLKVLKQVLVIFKLSGADRQNWWKEKSTGGKLAYVLKTILAVAIVGLVISSIVAPAAAIILVAASYIAASLQNFVGVFRKFPKVLAALKISSEKCKTLESKLKNENTYENRLALESEKIQRSQHRLAAVSQVANTIFNTIYIAAAILTIFVPPVGAIMLGLTALTNIVFGVSTLIRGRFLKKKGDAINKQLNKSIEAEKTETIKNNKEQNTNSLTESQENLKSKEHETNKLTQQEKTQEQHLFKHPHHHFSSDAIAQLALMGQFAIEPSLPKKSEELSHYKNHFVFAEDEGKVYFITALDEPKLVEGEHLANVKKHFSEMFESIARDKELKSQQLSHSDSESQRESQLSTAQQEQPREKSEEETRNEEGEGGNEFIEDEGGGGDKEKKEDDTDNDEPQPSL